MIRFVRDRSTRAMRASALLLGLAGCAERVELLATEDAGTMEPASDSEPAVSIDAGSEPPPPLDATVLSIPFEDSGGLDGELCSRPDQRLKISPSPYISITIECFLGTAAQTEQYPPDRARLSGTVCAKPMEPGCCVNVWPCVMPEAEASPTIVCPRPCHEPRSGEAIAACPSSEPVQSWQPPVGTRCVGSFLCDEWGVSMADRTMSDTRFVFWCASGAIQHGTLTDPSI